MRLPKTWMKTPAGHDLHLETGVEIRRNGRKWQVFAPHPNSSPYREVWLTGDSAGTLGDAAVLAVDTCLPKARAELAAAWDDAHFHLIGRPHEWKPGRVNKKTIAARRAAVAATGTPTGADAKPGHLVVHIATGAPGVFHGLKTFDRAFHDLPAGAPVAGVTFAGDLHLNMPLPYDPADVVVLTHNWLPCNQWSDEPGHEDHGDAVTGECLLPERDQELAGPALKWISRGYWRAEDGVELFRANDGTFSAYTPTPHGRHNLCSGQPRKERAYRMINQWRAELPGKIEEAHQTALDIIATQTEIDEAHLDLARADIAYEAAVDARRPGNYEASEVQKTKEKLVRAQLKLAHLRGRPFGYTRIMISERREGTSWKPVFTGLSEAKACETPSKHAERYAAMNHFRSAAYRVRVYSDPDTPEPDAEWTNLPEQPCRPGRHRRGARVLPGTRRADGSLVEATQCGTCFEPLWRVTPADGEPYPWLLEGEELPPVAPGVTFVALALITRKHYGMQINDGLGGWRTLNGVGGFSSDTTEVDVTVDGVTIPMPASTMVQLRPAPPDTDPGLDADYPDPTPTPDPTQTTPPDKLIIEGSGLGNGEIRYRVQTQTPTGMKIVQTGATPTGARTDLRLLAQTILGNAGPVLGQTSDQPRPGLLVQTWHWPTGQTATATQPPRPTKQPGKSTPTS